MTVPRTSLAGSFRAPWPTADLAGPVADDEQVEATLVLRRRADPPDEAFTGPPLTRDQLAEQYGADPAGLAAVTAAVGEAGAQVVAADAAARTMRVAGSAATLSSLFGTALQRGVDGGRRRRGELTAPAPVAAALLAVLGLDDRPQAAARVRSARASASAVSYSPVQVAAAYDFPDGDGSGETIAIVELGGGFAPDDLTAYFGSLGLPTPTVTAVPVDGAANEPGKAPGGADDEVLLDIEVAGAVAPAATQLVYFAPNTDAGFVDAVTAAAHATPAPAAISISWGQSEDQWTAQGRAALDAALADAALLGVTVCVAAGDNGSADAQSAGAPHVDFPASSPHALGCGGTTLWIAGDGTIASETVWNDGSTGGATGGGVSDVFALPSWQATAGVPARATATARTDAARSATARAETSGGRGVPDVAGNADPQTGYAIRVDGTDTVVGGTSAVAPLWAGLVARLAQRAGGSFGLIATKLYAGVSPGEPAAGFHDVTVGDNGAYDAAPGWDACTGLGTPDGATLSV